MEKTKKIVCIILMILMISVPFVSCADENKPEDTKAPGESQQNTDAASGENQEDVLEIPDETFPDEEFVILTPKIVTYCYALADFDEPSEDAYENAFYNRNLAVEERLGCKISQIENDMGGNILTMFQTQINSGSEDYDLVNNNMPSQCNAVGSGLCYNIDDIEYIDLDKSWWNDDATNQLSLVNSHFLIAGDILLSDKEGLWAIYFIKDHIAENGLENPYNLVAANQWTWDKMHEMATTAAFDQNADGKMDARDMWGFCTHHENYAASWQSAGLKLISIDEDGIPHPAWGTEEFVNVYEATCEIMGDTDVVYNDIPFITARMKDGNTLFGNEIVAFIRDYRENEYDFGILPYPKYNSDVDEYYSFIVTNACVVSIPKNCSDSYKTGIITETLAAYGKELLTPIYYDGQLKSRYSRDEESSAMLDIIFEHRAYDLGVFFDWGGAYSILQDPSVNPASTYAGLEKTINKSISKSLKALGIQ